MYASDPAAVISAPGALRNRASVRASVADSLLGSIGKTPLLSLAGIASDAPSHFELWAKAEFLNPTGSVKDRAAVVMVRQAMADGRLTHNHTLIDASSGNTAVAYAMLGAQLGFSVELCLPRNVHPERLHRIRAYGARVVFTDPLDGTDGAQREARRRSLESPRRYFFPDQYNNPANPRAHYTTTGPEIWEQSHGRITHFVAGVGTGGTISGVARFLKEQRDAVRVIGVQPSGPIHGIEGLKHIPSALRPSTYDESLVDETIRVETDAARTMSRQLARDEGLLVGNSSGAAVWAAREIGLATPGAIVVTILPDRGDRDGSEVSA
ncbi:MAG: cysteine synthase family protein [Thermoplasmata archaeon]